MFRQLHGGEKLVNIFVLWLANKKETLTKARHMVHYGDPILHTRSRESPASFRCFATFQQHVWIVMQYIAICLISLGTFNFISAYVFKTAVRLFIRRGAKFSRNFMVQSIGKH